MSFFREPDVSREEGRAHYRSSGWWPGDVAAPECISHGLSRSWKLEHMDGTPISVRRCTIVRLAYFIKSSVMDSCLVGRSISRYLRTVVESI
jgi:hypothetical protein